MPTPEADRFIKSLQRARETFKGRQEHRTKRLIALVNALVEEEKQGLEALCRVIAPAETHLTGEPVKPDDVEEFVSAYADLTDDIETLGEDAAEGINDRIDMLIEDLENDEEEEEDEDE